MRLQISSSSGAMNRQTTSLTRNADRIPLVKMTPGSSCCGFRCSMTSRVIEIEEARQMQAGDDQHHREQQHDGREIDAGDGGFRCQYAEHEHRHRADDRHGGPVDQRVGQPPDGEDQVAGEEDHPRCHDVPVRERRAGPRSSSVAPS